MGHAMYARDDVSSANDQKKFGIPVAPIKSPLEIAREAQDIATTISMSRDADPLRKLIGDCGYGALVSGILTVEEAVEVAARIHTEPAQQDRIAHYGGLCVGAEVGLRLLQEESLDSAIQPMGIV